MCGLRSSCWLIWFLHRWLGFLLRIYWFLEVVCEGEWYCFGQQQSLLLKYYFYLMKNDKNCILNTRCGIYYIIHYKTWNKIFEISKYIRLNVAAMSPVGIIIGAYIFIFIRSILKLIARIFSKREYEFSIFIMFIWSLNLKTLLKWAVFFITINYLSIWNLLK